MASKRSATQSGSASEPSPKKSFLLSDPVNLGPVSTEEELDIKVLKFQNAKLWSRLEEKNTQEEDYKSRLSHFDRIRKNDQNVISAMNLAWNQLDEDVLLFLQRFQEIPEDSMQDMSETTVAFLEKLSNRTMKGMKEEVSKRVNHSGMLIKRLVVSMEKVLNRSVDLSKLLHSKKEQVKIFKANKSKRSNNLSNTGDGSKTPINDHDENEKAEEENVLDMSSIELAIRQENAMLKLDNKRLHNTLSNFHDKYQNLSSEFTELQDKLATAQKENTELHAKQEDMQYDLQKATKQFEKLIRKLNETHEQVAISGATTSNPVGAKIHHISHPEDVKHDMEAKDELSRNRLLELEKLQESYQKLVEEHETLKQQMHDIPDDMIMSSTKYKILQTQFNLLFNDAQTIRKNCEDARKILVTNHSQHVTQVEQVENENIQMKKRVRGEVNQLEKALSESRKELEVLRVEYEHNMKAHEQIAPMAKEMRHLINSLQNHNQQLKGEVQRYKKRLTEAERKYTELQKKSVDGGNESPIDDIDRIEVGNASPQSESSQSSNEGSDYDDIKMLRTKLKSAREKRKEMKLLLDMYKGVSKETRDKVELLKNEKTLKDQVDILKAKLLIVTEDVVKQSRKFADDDHRRQCKKLEAKIEDLQKSISNMKQEENALLGEMEFTGQAFEEMQEQNIRLMQQLREKDDSNLKLMSERIKTSQIQKLLREEKEILTEQVSTMNSRHVSAEEVIKRLEEREKVLQTAVTGMESEMGLRLQANECHKRKSVEIGSQYQELIFKSESIGKQLDEVKKTVLDKTNRLEEETFKYNRVQEENLNLKKKLDRAKKMEYLGASDEILVEEVKMYKGKLTCPCCNTRPKDAILTKCFHVFCFECLKTRYDTRQRKCPKCNATFGNNDFHKIYM